SAGPYESIEILQKKNLFRKFLGQHNFNVPKFESFTEKEEALQTIESFKLPVIVKPTDSAGSKGVTKVKDKKELSQAINVAIDVSPTSTFIIEDFIEKKNDSSDTDCFSVNGKYEFLSFSRQRFDAHSPNPYTPSAYSWPSNITAQNQAELQTELQRLITLLGMKTSLYNIEVREGIDGKAYIMEVSPRGGGNRLSEMLHYATGTDLISLAIKAALGEEIPRITQPQYNGHWAEVVLYSNYSGKFKGLNIDPKLKNNIEE